MALIFLDIFYRLSSPHRSLAPPDHPLRVERVIVAGFKIVLLEARYVDDYIAIWRFLVAPSATIDSATSLVCSCLRLRLRSRYPLPLDDDSSDLFIGLVLAFRDGLVSITPSSAPVSIYEDIFAYPPALAFGSFMHVAMKRSVVLGTIARVNRYTLPESSKSKALRIHLSNFAAQGFPWSLLRKWAVAAHGVDVDWIKGAFDHSPV